MQFAARPRAATPGAQADGATEQLVEDQGSRVFTIVGGANTGPRNGRAGRHDNNCTVCWSEWQWWQSDGALLTFAEAVVPLKYAIAEFPITLRRDKGDTR